MARSISAGHRACPTSRANLCAGSPALRRISRQPGRGDIFAVDMRQDEPARAPEAAVAPPAGEAGTSDEVQVAEVLARLQAGVRQRCAEATTLTGATAETLGRLLLLKEREYLQEPVPFSHRPRWGRWIVFARKGFHKLFLRWMLRPVLAQQSDFNHAAAGLLQDLVEGQERQERRLAELASRVEALHAGAAPPRPSDPGASAG
jgi:hypothetical protein